MLLKTLFDKHKGKCHFCGYMTYYRKKGVPVAARATREHCLAWSLGGRNGDNVVLACSRCNALKSTMTAKMFGEIAKTLPPPVRFLRGKERVAALAKVYAEREENRSRDSDTK